MNEVLFALKGYSCFSANLNKGRGVLLYVKNSIPAVDVQQNRNFEESTWCKINLSGGDNIIIGCVYRSPNSTRENNLNLFDTIQDISGGNPSHLLILGDFNIKCIDWNNITSTENETHISTLFLECLRDSFLYQHVKEPTRYRSQNVPSILDLILTNEESMVSNLQYKPGLGKSDHLVLEFTYNCYIGSSDPQPRNYFFKGNYRKISEKLEENSWEQDLQGTSLSEAWEILTEKLIQLVEENVPVSKVSSATDQKTPYVKVSKVAKIRNRYNQVPHLTQDTNGKVTNSQKTPQTRAKRSALSQQVTTKHI